MIYAILSTTQCKHITPTLLCVDMNLPYESPDNEKVLLDKMDRCSAEPIVLRPADMLLLLVRVALQAHGRTQHVFS